MEPPTLMQLSEACWGIVAKCLQCRFDFRQLPIGSALIKTGIQKTSNFPEVVDGFRFQ